MKTILKLEEAGLLLLSVFLFSLLDYTWWVFPLLILTPDIGMIGYAFNPRIGAFTYNLFHHRGLAVLIYLAGFWAVMPGLQLAGIILLGHASMDRLFSFGLKYTDSFGHTHLGWLTQSKQKTDSLQ